MQSKEKIDVERLDILQVFSLSYRIFIHNFKKIYIITVLIIIAIVPIPFIYHNKFFNSISATIGEDTVYLIVGIFYFITPILAMCLQGAVTFGVIKALREEQLNCRECLLAGFSRIPAFLFLSLIFLFLFLIFAGFFSGIGALLQTIDEFYFILYIIIVSFLFFMIIITFSLITPICTIEKLGASKSFTRSQKLLMGNRIRVSGIILLSCILVGALIYFEFRLQSFIIENFDFISLFITILLRFISIIPLSFLFVILAITYFELKVINESYLIEQDASVFE